MAAEAGDADFSQLLDMGFEAPAIKSALAAGGGFEAALARLLEPAPAPAPSPVPAQAASQAPTPSPAAAPEVAPAQQDASLQQAAWLAAEALRIEARAAELDRAGTTAEALFHHKRASSKLAEAATLCPDGHPDKALLGQHGQDIMTRVVYLESLGGKPASLPIEDHVGELALSLDLSAARPPEQDVAALVAGVGVSGRTAPITEDGFQLVAALRSADEMRAYASRVLEGDWRRLQAGPEAEAGLGELAARFSTAAAPRSLAGLRDELRRAPWAELNIDPKQDRLQMGVALEKEARELEARGQMEEAARTYDKSIAVLQLVYKFDARCKNPKIKEMVGTRLEELQGRAKALKEALATPGAS